MPVAAANGIEINYTDSGGEGPAVVFSHGYLMDHTMFDRQVAALAPSRPGPGPAGPCRPGDRRSA